MKIGFIGCGNMAKAIITPLLLNENYEVYVSTRNPQNVNLNITVLSQEELAKACEIIFICVKPNQYQEILENLEITTQTIVSIAAGQNPQFLEHFCHDYVITMPNTGVAIRQGITSIVKNSSSRFDEVVKIFEYLGVVNLITQDDFDHYTVLYGSSPAIIYYLMDLFKGDPKVIAQIFKSCAEMVIKQDEDIKTLESNVCSPGGVTIQAINHLKKSDFDQEFKLAIDAAVNKSKSMKLTIK